MNNLIGENEKMTNQIIKCGSMEIPQLKLEMNTEEIELYMNNMITENPEILDAIDTMTMYEMEIYDLNEAQKNVFEVAARVIQDGWIDRDEIVSFLRSFKPVIPGWIDDMVIEALCMFLLAGENFRYGTEEKPELFEAISVALEDGIFCNKELGTILIEAI